MGAWGAWFAAVMLALGGIVTLAYLGVNLDAMIGTWMQGVAHLLGQPLLVL
jgi:hypothetical protein